jgi:Family of unknown function (DUF6279)
MITMSSDAMPLSLLPIASVRLRRIIGLALLAFLLAGCSMVRLSYNQAPNLLYWSLDGYVDFNGEQAPAMRDAVDRWLAWHRRTQLPDYAALLARAQREITEPTTPAAVCAWQAEVEQRLDVALEEMVPAAADLMLTLTPAQLQHIERRMAKGNDETRADFLQADPAERKAKALERSVERLEMLYGRLDKAQRERLAALLAASTFDPERWLAERRARQREVLQTLAAVGTAVRNGAGRDAARQQAEAAARVIIERSQRSPRADYRAYQQRLTQDNCALAATLHNAMSAAQRQVARARLKGWEDDARALMAGAPTGGPDDGAASR